MFSPRLCTYPAGTCFSIYKMGMLLPTEYSGWREFIRHLAPRKPPKISGFCFYSCCCCCCYCCYYWLAVSMWKGEVGKGDFFRYHTWKPQTAPPGSFRCSDVVCGYGITVPFMNLQPSHPLWLLQVAAVALRPSCLPRGLNPRAETTGGRCVPVSSCFGLAAQDQQPWSPCCR